MKSLLSLMHRLERFEKRRDSITPDDSGYKDNGLFEFTGTFDKAQFNIKSRCSYEDLIRSILRNLMAVIILNVAIGTLCLAQDFLPFPPAPSGSLAGVMIEGTIYRKRIEPRRHPADAPNILIILMDDLSNGTIGTPRIEYLGE